MGMTSMKNISYYFRKLVETAFGRVQKVDIDESLVSKVVEIKFFDPRSIGIVSKTHELTCTRFNHDEFSNRTIVGIVTNVGKWNGGPNFGKYIEVEVFKPGIGKRVFLLLKQEIEHIRILK